MFFVGRLCVCRCETMNVIGVLLVFAVFIQTASSQNGEDREYCLTEYFDAQCGDQTVISITRAFYGRHSIGRCVRRDFGYVGCGEDALSIIQSRCSGKQSCVVAISDSELSRLGGSCPKDLTRFLLAAYKCINGNFVVPLEVTTDAEIDGNLEHEDKEYCHGEEFRAQCSNETGISITKAFYGRHSIGRCVKTNYGYVGCGEDVLNIFQSRCSGKQSCAVFIPDAELDTRQGSCPRDLKQYLLVSYGCISVVPLEAITDAAKIDGNLEYEVTSKPTASRLKSQASRFELWGLIFAVSLSVAFFVLTKIG